MNGRTQLAELPPRGSLFYVGLFLGGVLIVAVLEACYAMMPLLNPHTTDGRVATFDRLRREFWWFFLVVHALGRRRGLRVYLCASFRHESWARNLAMGRMLLGGDEH